MHRRDRATKHEHQAQGEKDFADDFCFMLVIRFVCLYVVVCLFVTTLCVVQSIHTELAKLYSPESDLLLS
jgi:hypothetical protein